MIATTFACGHCGVARERIPSRTMRTTLTLVSLVVALVASSACGGGGGGAAPPPPPPNNGGGGATAGGDTGGGSAEAGVFMINNQSSQTICYAMISSHSDPNWGPDQLGDNTIPAGQSYAWHAGVGTWDVRLQDCNHNTLLENTDGIDISGAGTVLTVTDSQ